MPKDKEDIFQTTFQDGKVMAQDRLETHPKGPVSCLGIEFENDVARRQYFTNILSEKLKDPEFRKIEGFPLGKDEDILALSDPPYYTACPNPFLEEFIEFHGKPYDPNVPYSREPFATDVSEGKNDPIYNAHSYHTKVPHKAIMRYILHYTEPGDIVFDGFCGTGMTGVAAQLCGDKKTVESLGYKIQPDGKILDENGKSFSKLGERYAVLNDLSPVATFIAYNYNTPVDALKFEREAKRILDEVEKECGWMYETIHTDGKTKGKINYVVWSDVFICPNCSKEIVFWEAAFDKISKQIKREFQCKECDSQLNKKILEKAFVTEFDKELNLTTKQMKQVPVLINYKIKNKIYEKSPDKFDIDLIDTIKKNTNPYWHPTYQIPKGDKTLEPIKLGMTHIHHMYTKRSLFSLSLSYTLIHNFNNSIKNYLLFTIQQSVLGLAKISRYVPTHYSQVNQYLSGTLYIGSLVVEVSIPYIIKGKIKRLNTILENIFFKKLSIIGTSSSTSIDATLDNTVDYIFIDPPFGDNLMYSELNFMWESWLRVFTNNSHEAIQNNSQEKKLKDYHDLIFKCFKNFYKILKPGRWITVEFHNSKNNVWTAIQESLQLAGFIIADIRTLDKKQGSFNQMNSKNAVKRDLIITAYKPNGGLEERFKLEAGTENGAWDFITLHLKQLPPPKIKENKIEILIERQKHLLYDGMIAFHIIRGITVPLSAPDFYKGLSQRYPERDGMYFLPEQVVEYDKRRMEVKELQQLQLIITDEKSAIQWLKQLLLSNPQTFQNIHPQFLKELTAWDKYEIPLELLEILEQNFLRYDGNGPIPMQIVNTLKDENSKIKFLIDRELEQKSSKEAVNGLETKNEMILKAAKDRWYVPDPSRAADLEQVREKALLKEFMSMLDSGTKIKQLRKEACRVGFNKLWEEKQYKEIVNVAKKLPLAIIEEDPQLLMYLDMAKNRLN